MVDRSARRDPHSPEDAAEIVLEEFEGRPWNQREIGEGSRRGGRRRGGPGRGRVVLGCRGHRPNVGAAPLNAPASRSARLKASVIEPSAWVATVGTVPDTARYRSMCP